MLGGRASSDRTPSLEALFYLPRQVAEGNDVSTDGSAPIWRRTQRCDTGTCVEVARLGESFAVRDSKDVSGPILTFSAGAWADFVEAVRAGEFVAP
jgi:hypothetical protein